MTRLHLMVDRKWVYNQCERWDGFTTESSLQQFKKGEMRVQNIIPCKDSRTGADPSASTTSSCNNSQDPIWENIMAKHTFSWWANVPQTLQRSALL